HRAVEDGVHISRTKVDNVWHPSVTFIGAAITYGDTKRHAETHILNFNRNIIGKRITINLLRRIRGNRKFSSEQDLVAAIKADISIAQTYFK
ncbi:MAG: riboflavin kinase, partial [Bacteroidetes bacterium]|nr:riboflavin kinase [Bacteroidota bacterium]